MLKTVQVNTGYACVPYLHNYDSARLKDVWMNTDDIDSMYFTAATFSDESKPYFSSHVNHYLLAKYVNGKRVQRDMERFSQDKASFVLRTRDDLFCRELVDPVNFVSVYYLEYGESEEDMREVAKQVVRRDQVGRAVWGSMQLYCATPQKFQFPYSDNLITLEVSSKKGPRSVKKYCEKTRRDVCQKGIRMSNLFSLSLLERLK